MENYRYNKQKSKPIKDDTVKNIYIAKTDKTTNKREYLKFGFWEYIKPKNKEQRDHNKKIADLVEQKIYELRMSELEPRAEKIDVIELLETQLYKRNYTRILPHFIDFFGYDVAPDEIHEDSITEFIEHYRVKQGLQDSTVKTSLSVLQASLNKLHNQHPKEFRRFSIKSKYRYNEGITYLTPDEVDKLEKHVDKNSPEAVKMFLFACKTGVRKSDILKLNWKDNVLQKDGKTWVKIIEDKTRKTREFPLILEHLIQKDGYFFKRRTLNNDPIDRDLKPLLEMLGINKEKVFFHMSRHTFVTSMYMKGKDTDFIMRETNHSTPTQLYKYIHCLDLEEKRKDYYLNGLKKENQSNTKEMIKQLSTAFGKDENELLKWLMS